MKKKIITTISIIASVCILLSACALCGYSKYRTFKSKVEVFIPTTPPNIPGKLHIVSSIDLEITYKLPDDFNGNYKTYGHRIVEYLNLEVESDFALSVRKDEPVVVYFFLITMSL